MSASSASATAPKGDATMFELGSAVHAYSVAFDSGGQLWFVGGPVERTSVVGRLESDGSVIEYPIPGTTRSMYSASITEGPDGAMWFTDPYTGILGRASASGKIAIQQLPPGGGPAQLVSGPDGALWFTIPRKDQIGRMTLSGELTQFQFARHSGLTDIAVGPDGNIWFTLRKKSKIGRITPLGERTLFSLPKTAPKHIAAGPGGLWFTEGYWDAPRGNNRLGLISTAGRVIQFKVPAKNGTGQLAVGADGRIWFTAGGAIGWMSPSGELGPRVCLDDHCWLPPSSLAVAPDGVLWFGTDLQTCGICGGGSAQALGYQSGWVGHL
jgi:virginiamycin B lyase